MTRQLKRLPWLAPLLLSFCCVFRGGAQSNIVYNPSFEINVTSIFEGWSAAYLGGAVNEPGAADGGAWVSIGTGIGGIRANYPDFLLFQDLKTVPGRVYELRFATRGCLQGLKVLFGDTVAGTIDIGGSTGFWFYTNFTVTATSTNTRLSFDNSGGCRYANVDAVSVRWVAEPPSVIKPVVSRSAYEGATVSFSVKSEGVPPLNYQWYRDGQPLIGQTNSAFTLTNASLADNGRFFVAITNAFGEVHSYDAILAVSPLPQTPLILIHPQSQSLHSNGSAGYRATFFVTAVGVAPLSYQWQFNGNDLAGATNSGFTLPAANATTAGSYTVIVSNQFGTTVSLPAVLVVADINNSSTYADFDNLGAPIYDVDGVTKLEGSNYVAQLYTGPTSNALHAIGSPANFFVAAEVLDPQLAGVVDTLRASIPDVPAGANVYAQVRVWERALGESFEEAQAHGGKFGKSIIFTVPIATVAPLIIDLNLPASFSLEAGLPLYASAKLDPGQVQPDGSVGWLITGEVGSRYLIEYGLPPQSWTPLFIVTNQTGTVSFTDPNAATNSARIYRAQILDN